MALMWQVGGLAFLKNPADPSGIIGMDSVPGSFDITGIAPEASIYMYRVFDCNGHAGSDTIMAGMSKAYEDGVDIVSMSLGIGPASFSGAVDPLAVITKTLTDAGIAVIVAQSNDANETGEYVNDLYTEEWPSTEATALSVGSISNTYFPVVYSAVDSAGANLQYASVYPLNFPNGADVLIISNGCDSDSWNGALEMITNINETIIAFQVDSNCKATSAGSWSSSPIKPIYIMAFNANTTNPYLSQYDTPSQGYFGTTEFFNMNAHDGATFSQNYAAVGGYGIYKLKFSSTSFTSSKQPGGGLVDYYSSFGPTWHDYNLKPQISAPGGHILSTWPLGPLGGYAILSGTSMSTPYLAASYALVKSQFPKASIAEITNRLQVNSKPVPWIWNNNMLSATYQQGAGLVNVFNAIYTKSTISPGQLKISDNSRDRVWGSKHHSLKTHQQNRRRTLSPTLVQATRTMTSNIWSPASNLFTEPPPSQHQPSPSHPGQSTKVSFSVSPPSGVTPSNLPVFGGFINIADSDGDTFSIPYGGPPYSLYNTPYLLISSTSSGIDLPSVYAFNADQSDTVYDTGLLDFVASYGFSGAIPTLQWTTEFSLSVLPANTSIKPDHYGFNKSTKYPYQPSAFAPNSTLFGYPSFGTVVNNTGLMWPANNSPFVVDTSVTGNNGVSWQVGNGDYRWFAAVLRWGGTSGRQEDYDTWLGPVMRFVNGTGG
jgi:subtilisin family serine protease